MEQFFTRDQPQNGIPQKLELFVVADPVLALARQLRFLLPRLRTVRDRLLEDRAPPEVIAQLRFQRRDFSFFHSGNHVRTTITKAARRAFAERGKSSAAVPAAAQPALFMKLL